MRRIPCFLLCISFSLVGGAELAAQQTLRWKFEPGAVWKVHLEQNTHWQTSIAGKTSPIRIDSHIDLTWTIDSVRNDGTAVITQRCERLRLARQSAKLAELTYDSAIVKPTGDAKIFAEALAPFLAATLPITLSPRGELGATEIPADLLASLSKSPALQALLQGEGVNSLFRPMQIVLPEGEVKSGDHWEQTREVESSFGSIQQLTKYELLPPEPSDEKLAHIGVTSTFTPPPAQDDSRPTIKTQQQQGIVLFDTAAGRLRSSEITQTLTTVSTRKETAVEVRLENTVKMKLEGA